MLGLLGLIVAILLTFSSMDGN